MSLNALHIAARNRLIVIGALFFVAPEQAFALRWLMRLCPSP